MHYILWHWTSVLLFISNYTVTVREMQIINLFMCFVLYNYYADAF